MRPEYKWLLLDLSKSERAKVKVDGNLLSLMRLKNLITENELEELQSKAHNNERLSLLVRNILPRKLDDMMEDFILALKESGQEEAVRFLREALDGSRSIAQQGEISPSSDGRPDAEPEPASAASAEQLSDDLRSLDTVDHSPKMTTSQRKGSRRIFSCFHEVQCWKCRHSDDELHKIREYFEAKRQAEKTDDVRPGLGTGKKSEDTRTPDDRNDICET